MSRPNNGGELRLGTRGSRLALWQANMVATRIAQQGGPACRIVVITTTGDQLQEAPLSKVGGKRLFVKELEDALLHHEIDLAVHSSKDMSAVLPEGLTIAAVLPREDPLDAVVLPMSHAGSVAGFDQLVTSLGRSPSIGTGSVRRIAQLIRIVPAGRFTPVRGNLDTRLRKLDSGDFDALILAAAGLRRLGFESRISLTLPVSVCVPAPGQGIVATEIRADDEATRRAVAPINDAVAAAALGAERALVVGLGGGCQTPIGALATVGEDNSLDLTAVVAALDGSRVFRRHARGPRVSAEQLGARLAAQLIADGAGEILAQVARELGPTGHAPH